MDGTLLDTREDDSQKSGTVGVQAAQPNTALLHHVSVTVAGKTVFRTNFEKNANPFTVGSPTPNGLLVAAGAPGAVGGLYGSVYHASDEGE